MTTKPKFIIPLLAALLTAACDYGVKPDTSDFSIDATPAVQSIKFDKPEPIHIEIFYPQDEKLSQVVSLNQPRISLINALAKVINTPIIAGDDKVNLHQQISVNFAGNLGDYLTYLSNLTNYHITLKNNGVFVQAIIAKSWNLASISSDTSDIPEGEDNDKIKRSDASEWIETIKTIIEIVGGIGGDSDGQSNNDDKTLVSANQKTGVVYVRASPQKIKQVDKYIRALINSSTKQIHLAVTVLDVSLDRAKGRGIDWSIVAEGARGAFGISSVKTQSIDGAGLISIGTINEDNLLQRGDVSIKLLISLLERQGKVIVQDQPNITVLNGDTGIISTGTEFSYIAQVNANTDQSGNVVTTSEIERLNVGVSMQVKAKVLGDDEVLINVVPVVSSLQNFTEITSNAESFQTPNITLQKLSTQAIVKSGKTMHLGGLIAERVVEASKALPGNWFSAIFASDQSALEKREIVILIKPTII